MLRWAAAGALLLVGALTAAATVVSHELWWSLPLATAGLAASYVAVGPGWLTRLPIALGCTAVVGIALQPRPEGDYLVLSSTRGYLLLGLTLVALVVALVTLPRPHRRPHRASGCRGGGRRHLPCFA